MNANAATRGRRASVTRWIADKVDTYTCLPPRRHMALMLLPPAIVLLFILLFHVDLPYQDQLGTEWYQIHRAMMGHLTLSDLWMQHNEHRVLVPSLLWIPLALLTRWSVLAEVIAGLVISCATFALLAHQARRVMHDLGVARSSAVLPLLSVVFFSLDQWENWLFGFGIVMFVHVFALTLGTALLLHPSRRPWHLAGAALCAAAATYSLLNGLIFWAIGLVVLVLDVRARVRSPGALLFWVSCAAITCATYFHEYHLPASHPSPLSALHDPLGFGLYTLTLLGSPVLTYYIAGIAGLLGLIALAWSLVSLSRLTSLRSFAFFIVLAGYAILTTLMIGVGRVGFGWKQALSSRYVTLVSGLWLALIVLLYCLAALLLQIEVQKRASRATSLAALAVIAAMAVVCSAGGSYLGYTVRYRPISEVRRAILSGTATDTMLRRLYPDPVYARAQLDLLRQAQLSLFCDAEP